MSDLAQETVREAIQRAIDLKGSEEKLAVACGVTQSAISKAKLSGRISDRLAIAIHRETNGDVPGNVLRRDLWRLPEHVPVDADNHAQPEAQAAQ